MIYKIRQPESKRLFSVVMPCCNRLDLNILWAGGSHMKVMKKLYVEKVWITLFWDLDMALHWAVQKVYYSINSPAAVGLLLCPTSTLSPPSFRAGFFFKVCFFHLLWNEVVSLDCWQAFYLRLGRRYCF